ncbi:ATP-binding protein, partial [Candidatus Bipolaricaulota bacterium]|nr:ATP-binding protein [Candidatus Bipolaricaulota bacterium]
DLPLLLSALDRFCGLTILASNLEMMMDDAVERRVTLQIGFELPSPSLRRQIWKLHLPKDIELDEDVDLAELADKYEFSGGHIRNSIQVALSRVLAEHPDAPRPTMQHLDTAARSQIRHRLAKLATYSRISLTLNDLVLPEDVFEKIQEILAAVRNRRVIFEEWGFSERLPTGRGLCMLFRGDSGTGKTLTAEVLGSEIGMPIYRVNIGRIVSKYIGETEKNLEKAFHEAALSGSILLFDEADAIFSKRVDVKDSVDRYSNMEVNLLLQEIERFEGIVILTTNLDAAIDDAFERRLNFKLDFPFPNKELRAHIWRRIIPDRAPIEDGIDFEVLGEDFELSGGSIKNSVVRAAYMAARRKDVIRMDDLERAAIQEYRELGKLPPYSEGWG